MVEILNEINDKPALAHMEEVMLMVPQVIAADSVKHAQEKKLLSALIDRLNVPENVMSKAYTRYFDDKMVSD